MTLVVNVKAKGNTLRGYSFKVNEPKIEAPQQVIYLKENIVNEKFREGISWILPISVSVGLAKAFAFKGPMVASVSGVANAVPTIGRHVDLFQKLMPLIHIIQDIALPVAIIVASWGCVEWMIGQPGYKQKLKSAVIGYGALFMIPFLFTTIRDVLVGL